MCWVYRKTKDGSHYLYTVGYYAPSNYDTGELTYEWVPIQDCNGEEHAQRMVSYLNGGVDWRK